MPPPTSLRARRARQMTSREPTSTDPTGQPRPLLRQNVTVSAGPARSRAVDAVRALGDDGVPEAGAIDVERDAASAGDRRDLAGVRRA